MLHLPPKHVHPVFLLWGELELEVVGHVLEFLPHLDPPLFLEPPELFDHIIGPQRLLNRKEEGELGVVELILIGELNPITDDHRHTVAHDSVKEAAR